jgi:AbiV family abortive infection protein
MTGFADHLWKYWDLARSNFEAGEFPLATFLAITLIEEAGKSRLIRRASAGGFFDCKAFRSHEEKYAHAVISTLLINARVTRIYGPEEQRFAHWFRDGELFQIRNRALYAEFENGVVTVPRDVISRDDAFLFVCIAGEVLAEIQGETIGTGPSEWQDILSTIDEFRRRNVRAGTEAEGGCGSRSCQVPGDSP